MYLGHNTAARQSLTIKRTNATSTNNGVDLTGLLGGHKGRLGVWGTEVPQKLKLFCETTHNICIKIQQTTVAVTLADILNNITSKILGGHYHGCPPFLNIGGTCPPYPIGIDAPVHKTESIRTATLPKEYRGPQTPLI